MRKKHFLSAASAILALTAVIGMGALSVSAEKAAGDTASEPIVTIGAADQTAVTKASSANDTGATSVISSSSGTAQAASTKASTDNIKKKKTVSWPKVIIIAVVISVIITGASVFGIYHSYKHNGMTEPYEYTKKAPLELAVKEDDLVDVKVTKRQIERNNN